MEQVQYFKQESDMMCLVLRTHTWLLVKNKLKGHSGKRETGQAATQVSPKSKFPAMERGGGHPT